jgi:hypothetical protein
MAENLLRAAGTLASLPYAKAAPRPSAATSSPSPPAPPATVADTSSATCPKTGTADAHAAIQLAEPLVQESSRKRAAAIQRWIEAKGADGEFSESASNSGTRRT